MPSQVPRNNTSKKRDQLLQREQELQHALRAEFSRERLIGAAEKLRAAHLSLLKAELYWAQDAEVRGREIDERIAKIQSDTERWLARPIDEILHDHMA